MLQLFFLTLIVIISAEEHPVQHSETILMLYPIPIQLNSNHKKLNDEILAKALDLYFNKNGEEKSLEDEEIAEKILKNDETPIYSKATTNYIFEDNEMVKSFYNPLPNGKSKESSESDEDDTEKKDSSKSQSIKTSSTASSRNKNGFNTNKHKNNTEEVVVRSKNTYNINNSSKTVVEALSSNKNASNPKKHKKNTAEVLVRYKNTYNTNDSSKTTVEASSSNKNASKKYKDNTDEVLVRNAKASDTDNSFKTTTEGLSSNRNYFESPNDTLEGLLNNNTDELSTNESNIKSVTFKVSPEYFESHTNQNNSQLVQYDIAIVSVDSDSELEKSNRLIILKEDITESPENKTEGKQKIDEKKTANLILGNRLHSVLGVSGNTEDPIIASTTEEYETFSQDYSTDNKRIEDIPIEYKVLDVSEISEESLRSLNTNDSNENPLNNDKQAEIVEVSNEQTCHCMYDLLQLLLDTKMEKIKPNPKNSTNN